MKIREKKKGGSVFFSVEGELTHEGAQALYERMLNALNRGDTSVVLDLEGCGFVSSSGLGTIAAALMIARSRGGDLKIRRPRLNVRSTLNITKLDEIVEIEDDS
ncbi:MAG: STAS domain-containing protein [bacterium]